MWLFYALVYAPAFLGAVVVVGPWLALRLRGGPMLPTSPLAIVAGAALSVAGSVVMWRCVWDFGHVGRGTPAPFAAPTRHVTVGFYRRVRNPMQMGLILSLFGLAAAYMAIWILGYALAVCVCMHLFVVLYEEPTLRRKFGESYRAYCASVPRWIPRVRRASAA